MKIIKDGDCYNQVLYTKDGRQYDSIREPTRDYVLGFIWYREEPVIQIINYCLCRRDAGFIFEIGDDLGVLIDNGVTADRLRTWLTMGYYNKVFSWQKEVIDE